MAQAIKIGLCAFDLVGIAIGVNDGIFLNDRLRDELAEGIHHAATAVGPFDVQEMVSHIQIILKEYNYLLDKKDSMEELKDKELTICTFDAFSELFTTYFLQTFMQTNPKIILNIEESSDAQVTNMPL